MADGDQLTKEQYDAWIPAQDAIRRVSKAMGSNWEIPATTIIRRLNAGRIRAHVRTGTVEKSGKTQDLNDFVAIPKSITQAWENAHYQSTFQFWISGDAEVTIRVLGDYGHQVDKTYRLFGIRFDPAGIEEMAPGAIQPQPSPPTPLSAPTPPASPTPPPALPRRAGRPPKDFWEDMVIAATRAILYDDTLKAKTQADVQRWMADWAIANGHGDPGETALKERARKVFLACQD